ncbi:MAG: phosphonate ABC transporter, permease protein PhnE [Spirochaetaceae bacterium]|nr:phosphonate ABC transporter, permease protein PhnE [Spirochaetaceae bacterium]
MGRKPVNSSSIKSHNDALKFFRHQRLKMVAVLLLFMLLYWAAAALTDFHLMDSFEAVPRVVNWFFSNLIPDQKALSRLPKIVDKLVETIFMSIMATVTAGAFSFVLAVAGSNTTSPNIVIAGFSRFIASVFRNIPIAVWAMIFLLAFGQSSFTGFLALFFYSFGFLVRAFIETIDDTASSSVEALTASGASYPQIIAQAVVPASMPQMISWMLYMIETNIRSATLVGLLTGSGIGFMFSIYFKSLQYTSAALVVISLVSVVLLIELLSNLLRRLIL